MLFNKDEKLKTNLLNNGLFTVTKKNVLLNNQKLQLDYKLFENDALVLLDMKSDKIALLDKDDEPILKFEFYNFPYFGLWTLKVSGFICLEPWAGISDFGTHNQDIKVKTGISMIQLKGIWFALWTISIPF